MDDQTITLRNDNVSSRYLKQILTNMNFRETQEKVVRSLFNQS